MTQPDPDVLVSEMIGEASDLEDGWRWAEALDSWDGALRAAEDDDHLRGECECGRARVLQALDRPDEADEADRAAAVHFAAAGEPALARLAEASPAIRAAMGGHVEEALAIAHGACDAIDRLHDDPQAPLVGARARQTEARILFAAGRPDDGERRYLEARDRFADAGDDRRLARCDAALAMDLLATGRLEDAEGRAEAAAAGLTMLDQPVEAAQLQLLLGRLQAEGGRHDEALGNFRAAQAVFSERELWPAAAEAMHLEALVLAATDEEAAAVDCFEGAIEIAMRAGMAVGEGTGRLELAVVLGRLGRLDESAAQFELARDALAGAGDELGAAHATFGLASTRREAGDLSAALDTFTTAAESFAAAGAVGAQGQSLFDAGAVLAQLGRLDDALASLDQAAAAFAADGEPLHVASVRRAWGATAGFASRPEGLDALAEARSIFVAQEATWDVADCDGMLSQVLESFGRHEEAVGAGEASVAGFRSVQDRVAVVAAETVLGRALAGAGRAVDAVRHLQLAITSAVDEGVESMAAPAHEALADVYEALARPADAALHHDAAMRLVGDTGQSSTER